MTVGIFLPEYSPEALNVTRNHRKGDVAPEPYNAVVRTLVQAVGLQRINGRFDGRMLLT
jgi:hypothetical protein